MKESANLYVQNTGSYRVSFFPLSISRKLSLPCVGVNDLASRSEIGAPDQSDSLAPLAIFFARRPAERAGDIIAQNRKMPVVPNGQ